MTPQFAPGLRVSAERILQAAHLTPAHAALGTRLVSAARNSVVVNIPWQERLCAEAASETLANGVVASLLDHATGLASLVRVAGEGVPAGTMDLRVDYIRQPDAREALFAEGECYNVNGRVARVRGLVWGARRPQDPIAHCSGTYAVTPGEGSGNELEVLQIPQLALGGAQPDDVACDARALPLSPYHAFLGLRQSLMEETSHLPGWSQHVGSYRRQTVHGGVIIAQLEAAASHHLCSQNGARRPLALNVTTEFLRPAPLGEVHARARVLRLGRTIAFVRAEAWQENPDRPIALLHGVFQLGNPV